MERVGNQVTAKTLKEDFVLAGACTPSCEICRSRHPKYEQSGHPKDFAEEISLQRRSLQLAPASDSDRPVDFVTERI